MLGKRPGLNGGPILIWITWVGTPSTGSSPPTGESCSVTRTSPTSTARTTGARVFPRACWRRRCSCKSTRESPTRRPRRGRTSIRAGKSRWGLVLRSGPSPRALRGCFGRALFSTSGCGRSSGRVWPSPVGRATSGIGRSGPCWTPATSWAAGQSRTHLRPVGRWSQEARADVVCVGRPRSGGLGAGVRPEPILWLVSQGRGSDRLG